MSGKIIALVGPSGVGKNFAKQAIKDRFPNLSELTIYTTRSRRTSDGIDRETDISVENFLKMVDENKIIAAHQPFGINGDWYGFSKEQIDKMLENNDLILTEIHPDNMSLFKKLYGKNVFAIALTAKKEYLEHNLKERDSEKEADRNLRLNSAINEINIIQRMQKEGLINKIIEIDWDNRDKLSELVVNEVLQETKPQVEQENKIKFK